MQVAGGEKICCTQVSSYFGILVYADKDFRCYFSFYVVEDEDREHTVYCHSQIHG